MHDDDGGEPAYLTFQETMDIMRKQEELFKIAGKVSILRGNEPLTLIFYSDNTFGFIFE